MSKIEVNTVDVQCGSTLTLGSSGKTVTLASGASQSGFGRTGTVDWCTTAKTSPLTVVSGKGYFINTTSGGVTVTLPASPSAGDIVAFKDYANTWDSNAVTICRNGSKINGACFNTDLNTESQSVTLIYVDGTKGWQDIHDSTANITGAPNFIVATGGDTVATCGDFKIHTFTGDGTFTVQTAPTPANNNVSYLVVAGGGGGGGDHGGGGGAGGFREGKTPATPYTASPLVAPAGLPVSTQAYPITVGGGGGGGAGAPSGCNPSPPQGMWGGNGTNSTFSTITSAGGGGGAKEGYPYGNPTTNVNGGVGRPGGSGGGGSYTSSNTPAAGTGGSGNQPPVSPPQGNPGGTSPSVGGGSPYNAGQGGGGATAAGTGVAGPAGCANGGAGATTHITGSPVAYAGGGGGARGGTGACGGGNGGNPGAGTAGTANKGSGGGGGYPDTAAGGSGGSGIVVIRYKFQ